MIILINTDTGNWHVEHSKDGVTVDEMKRAAAVFENMAGKLVDRMTQSARAERPKVEIENPKSIPSNS